MNRTHLVTLEVSGRPATFATTGEMAWKRSVREAIAASGVEQPGNCRFAVRVTFRTAIPRTSGEVWDIDNLIKPTLDAMEGVFGERVWLGHPQPADDRVDELVAYKRSVSEGEEPGALVEVWTLHA